MASFYQACISTYRILYSNAVHIYFKCVLYVVLYCVRITKPRVYNPEMFYRYFPPVFDVSYELPEYMSLANQSSYLSSMNQGYDTSKYTIKTLFSCIYKFGRCRVLKEFPNDLHRLAVGK